MYTHELQNEIHETNLHIFTRRIYIHAIIKWIITSHQICRDIIDKLSDIIENQKSNARYLRSFILSLILDVCVLNIISLNTCVFIEMLLWSYWR